MHETLTGTDHVSRADSPRPARHIFPKWRWWTYAIVAVVVGVAAYLAYAILNWPFKQQALIDVLQERSVRSVTIDHFYRTYWPPGCVAEGVAFLHRKHKNKPPLITIGKLVVNSTYPRLLFRHSLSKVIAIGMHVTVPPANPNLGSIPMMPLTESKARGPALVIGTVIADGAVLDFVSRDPHKKPFRIVINRLALTGVGNNRPLGYVATISNSLPPGKIDSSGTFGSWNPDNPASTPVNGSFTYRYANLAVFKAFSGTLSASGKFTGTLGNLETTGTAEVLQFQLTDTAHSRKLSAEFQAVVDATGGNTVLQNVTAHFDRTTVLFEGKVTGLPGQEGKALEGDLFAGGARIEDLLNLFIASSVPPMTGNITLRAHIDVPPGPEGFIQRMKLEGDFGANAGKFMNKEMQASIDRLSKKKDKGSIRENPETALSDLKGQVTAQNGIATLSQMSFRASDATAWLDGTYGLLEPYRVDLHGHLLSDHPSDAATGFESFLLKAISPFLKKRGKQKSVPIKITGTYQHVDIGLDLGRAKK